MRKVNFNGDNITIDNGLFFGKGIFETILIKEKPVFLKEHLNRLNESINKLNLGELISYNDVEEIIVKNRLKNIVLKIVVTDENIVYSTRPIKYEKKNYDLGFKLKFTNVLRNPTSMLTYIKSTNYIENIIEHEKAEYEGYNDVIFKNYKGYIAECSIANIFYIKDGNIFTPRIEDGLLPGVIRKWIIDNYSVSEKHITEEDIINADEVFITNSIVGIMKVSEIENNYYGSDNVEKIRMNYEKVIMG